jgi:hypothetical protein
MSIQVSWDTEEKKAIRLDFAGQWTLQDFRVAVKEEFALAKSVTHQVDIISNLQNGAALPSNAFLQFKNTMNVSPENIGMVAIVGTSVFVKTMVSVFSKVYTKLGDQLLTADSLEEARLRLAEKRQAKT